MDAPFGCCKVVAVVEVSIGGRVVVHSEVVAVDDCAGSHAVGRAIQAIGSVVIVDRTRRARVDLHRVGVRLALCL